MKKYIKSLAWIAALAFAVVSCQEKIQPHEPGEPEASGCYGVYFPTQAASGSHVYNPTQDPSVEITVARTNTSGAVTVPVVLTTSEDGIFSLGDVSFADGQEETVTVLRFDNAVEGTTYSASLLIEGDQYASKYNSSPVALDFSVMRVEMKDFLNPVTGEPALITLNEGWWNETHMAKMKYYEVDGVRTCTIYSVEDGGIWGDTVNATLQFNWYTKNNNGEGNNLLEVQKQYFGFDYADWASKPVGEAANPIYVYDYYWYHIERQTSGIDQFTWMEFAKKYGDPDGGYPIGYYDGNGGFYFTLRYYIPGLGGFSSDPYEFVAIVDGFTRVDYSLEAESDYSVDGVTPVSIEAGVDVASIKYAVYEGELTATQVGNKVAAVMDGTDASTEFSDFELDEEEAVKYATLELAPETTGVYTFVAVAYDESGKAQNNTSVTFKHVAAGDVDEYAVDIKVGAEEIPARYGEYDPSESFAFYVVGNGITEAHISYVETAKYQDNVEGYNAKVKAAKAVSAETLAQINKAGGYYGLVDGVRALTSYTVIVWATNGDTDTIATTEWTTAGLPNELLCVGTYTYDSWWEGEDDAQELYVNPNFENTYVFPNWGGGVDFSFTMDENGEIYIPTFYIGADHSSYGAVYYVDPFDWYSDESLAADETKAVHSYYDAKTNTYNFHFVLAVSAGSFGHFWESYTPSENANAASVMSQALANALRSAKLQSSEKGNVSLPQPWVSAVREPQQAKVAVKVATAARKTTVKNLDQYVPVR
ncbi:MAG: hypothetical protein IKS71_07865 [Bacteroidales bacterium]|nr:hypothetical protein [Bacteroidales bacterium]